MSVFYLGGPVAVDVWPPLHYLWGVKACPSHPWHVGHNCRRAARSLGYRSCIWFVQSPVSPGGGGEGVFLGFAAKT